MLVSGKVLFQLFGDFLIGGCTFKGVYRGLSRDNGEEDGSYNF